MLSKNQLKLVRSLELKKNRKKEGLFVAEGPKVVGDLLRAGYVPHSIFSTNPAYLSSYLPASNLPALLGGVGGRLLPITDDELRKLSFLQHPQEVLALFEIPSPGSLPFREGLGVGSLPSLLGGVGGRPLSIALDGIQDPGNLGTIIRIADWFGISTIYCSEDTADAYNPKVVQATMGSLAHINIVYCDLVALLQQYDGPIYGTLLDGNDIYQQELSEKGIIVMGNEGNGISQRVRPLITHKLLIPNFNKNSETAESLNVAIATAITCSEFRRR
jgi:TrmH family RNA methyltransferase